LDNASMAPSRRAEHIPKAMFADWIISSTAIATV
jgi:hypothetical protein